MGRLKSDDLVAETMQGSDWNPAFSMEIVKIRSGGVGWDTSFRQEAMQTDTGDARLPLLECGMLLWSPWDLLSMSHGTLSRNDWHICLLCFALSRYESCDSWVYFELLCSALVDYKKKQNIHPFSFFLWLYSLTVILFFYCLIFRFSSCSFELRAVRPRSSTTSIGH